MGTALPVELQDATPQPFAQAIGYALFLLSNTKAMAYVSSGILELLIGRNLLFGGHIVSGFHLIRNHGDGLAWWHHKLGFLSG